jgi:hypothetical protein
LRAKYITTERNLIQKSFIPNFQWAQNREYVILEVRLSDDKLTCKENEDEFVDLFASGLDLQGQCIVGDNLYKFKLKLNFFDEINRLNSLFNFERGKYLFMLKKKSLVKWDSLTKENVGAIWKEMQDKYDEDERKAQKEREDDEEEDVEEDTGKKGRRKNYNFAIGDGKRKGYKEASYWDY